MLKRRMPGVSIMKEFGLHSYMTLALVVCFPEPVRSLTA